MSRRALWAVLNLIAVLALAACDRTPQADVGPGVDLSDPEVGGGAGQDTGPQTPVPTATATREASPRQDGAGTPIALPPTPTPTSPPPDATEPPATKQPIPPTLPPTETPPPPTETPAAPPPEPTTAPPVEPTATPAGDRFHIVQAGENLYRIGLLYGLPWVAIAEYNGLSNPNQITVGQELRIPPSPTATPGTEQGSGGAGERGGEVAAGGESLESSAAVAEAGADAGDPIGSPGAPPSPAAGAPTDEEAGADAGDPPVVAEVVQGPPTHTVAAGETVYSISQRYGINWAQLAEANGLSAPNQIVAGQVLKIPTDVPGPTPEFNHRVHAGETLSRIAGQYGLSPAALAEANGLAAPYVIYPGQMLVIPGD